MFPQVGDNGNLEGEGISMLLVSNLRNGLVPFCYGKKYISLNTGHSEQHITSSSLNRLFGTSAISFLNQ